MRSFIAIPVDKQATEALKTYVEILKKTFGKESVRWIPEQNYHLTLHFLGDGIDETTIENIINSMSNWFSEGMSFFEAEILKIQLFPSSNKPHTIVAALDATIMMQYLVREIEDHLKPLGFKKSRQVFRPHISLGRITKQADSKQLLIPKELEQIEDLWLEVDTITLYESKLTGTQPTYSTINSITLERY